MVILQSNLVDIFGSIRGFTTFVFTAIEKRSTRSDRNTSTNSLLKVNIATKVALSLVSLSAFEDEEPAVPCRTCI